MKKRFGTFLFLALLASCITAFASNPIPSELRKWIEDQNPKDKTPANERIFVDDMRKESAIVRYHKGMTLQEVLDQVKFQDVVISIYRAGHKPTGEPVYDEPVLLAGERDRTAVLVQPLDVIYLWNGNRN